MFGNMVLNDDFENMVLNGYVWEYSAE